MGRIPIRIRAFIAVIVVIAGVAGVVFYLKSRPTVTLHNLFTIAGYCQQFSEDGSLIDVYEYPPDYSGLTAQVVGQSIYDAKLGTVRLHLPSVVNAISFSSDSAFVGASGKGVYDLHSGQLVVPLGSAGYLFSPDNHFVATTTDGVYDLVSSKQVVSANGPYYWFSPDNQFVAASTSGVYALASGKQVVSVTSVSAVAFSHDSHSVALIGDEDAVYDLTTGQQMFSAPRDKGFGTAATFSPDGKYLSVESDGIYQVATGKKIVQTGALSFSADSSMAATALGVFDLVGGKRIFPETVAKDSTAFSKFSSDGKTAVILTYEPPARPTDAIITTVFDLSARKTIFQLRTPGEGRVYFDAIFSPDSKSLAVWHDGVYDVATGKKRFAIDPKGGFSTYTNAPLSFSKDNSLLYVSDGAAYDMQTGNVRFAMNGDTLETLGSDKAIMGDMEDVSNDGRLLSDLVGVYDFATGIRLAKGEVKFPPNGNKVAVSSKPNGTCDVFETVPA